MSSSEDVKTFLENEVAHDIAEAAKLQAAEVYKPDDPLHTMEQEVAVFHHELSQCMLLAKTRIKDGFEWCVEAIKELSTADASIDIPVLEENVHLALSRFDTVAKAKDMCAEVAEGKPWRSLLGLTDRTMELLYSGAKHLFDLGHYPESEAAFFFLSTIDYAQYAFWLGLGHAAFHLGNYNQAINAYEMANACQPGSIWPFIYIANCFEALYDFEESYVQLQNALGDLQTNPNADHALLIDLKERIANAKSRR